MPGQRFGNPDAHVVDAAVQRLLQRVQEPAFIAQLNLLQAERASLQAVQSVNDAELGRLWGVVGRCGVEPSWHILDNIEQASASAKRLSWPCRGLGSPAGTG